MTSEHKSRGSNAGKRRAWLIQSICEHLLPVFIKHGFQATPAVHREPVDPEYVQNFPDWGRFIRHREPGVDLIEIQLARYGGASFRINMGVAPSAGIMTLRGQWPAENVLVHWLDEFFEVYAVPQWRIWFYVRPRLYRSRGPRDYDTLALRVAQLVPELEVAFQEGREGLHVRRVVMPPTSVQQ